MWKWNVKKHDALRVWMKETGGGGTKAARLLLKMAERERRRAGEAVPHDGFDERSRRVEVPQRFSLPSDLRPKARQTMTNYTADGAWDKNNLI